MEGNRRKTCHKIMPYMIIKVFHDEMIFQDYIFIIISIVNMKINFWFLLVCLSYYYIVSYEFIFKALHLNTIDRHKKAEKINFLQTSAAMRRHTTNGCWFLIYFIFEEMAECFLIFFRQLLFVVISFFNSILCDSVP